MKVGYRKFYTKRQDKERRRRPKVNVYLHYHNVYLLCWGDFLHLGWLHWNFYRKNDIWFSVLFFLVYFYDIKNHLIKKCPIIPMEHGETKVKSSKIYKEGWLTGLVRSGETCVCFHTIKMSFSKTTILQESDKREVQKGGKVTLMEKIDVNRRSLVDDTPFVRLMKCVWV